MTCDHLPVPDPVPDHPVGRRVRARVRPLLRRAAQRRADRGLLDRLRAGAVRPQRSARHALEVQRHPARRLRQDAGRRRRHQLDHRPARTPATPTAFRPRACGSGWPSSWPGRWPTSSSRSSRWRSCSRPSAARSRRPRSATVQPDSPAAAAGLMPGDRITGGRRHARRELRGAAGDRARQCRPSRSTFTIERDGETLDVDGHAAADRDRGPVRQYASGRADRRQPRRASSSAQQSGAGRGRGDGGDRRG